MPIFRWDIDKTYLETDFQSLSGLWRAATESAKDKVAVSGVVPLVKSLNTVEDSQLVFLSGSPRQMRKVLLKKFSLDGIHVDNIFLKDSLGAISKGRFSEVKGQFGHKLSNLLRHRIDVQGLTCAQTEYLFGDDVEQDALIYATYAMLLRKEMGWQSLKGIAKIANTYSDVIDVLGHQFSEISQGFIGRIFIRLTKHQIPRWMNEMAPLVVPVHCWSQAAMVLFIEDVLTWEQAQVVFHEECMDVQDLANLAQDLHRRRLLGPQQTSDLYKQIGKERYILPFKLSDGWIVAEELTQMFKAVS